MLLQSGPSRNTQFTPPSSYVCTSFVLFICVKPVPVTSFSWITSAMKANWYINLKLVFGTTVKDQKGHKAALAVDRSLEPVSTSLELFEPTRDSSHLGPNYFIYSFRWFLWTLLVLDSLLRAEDKIVKLTEITAPIGNGGGKRQIYLLKFKWKVTGRISFSLPGSLTQNLGNRFLLLPTLLFGYLPIDRKCSGFWRMYLCAPLYVRESQARPHTRWGQEVTER